MWCTVLEQYKWSLHTTVEWDLYNQGKWLLSDWLSKTLSMFSDIDELIVFKLILMINTNELYMLY